MFAISVSNKLTHGVDGVSVDLNLKRRPTSSHTLSSAARAVAVTLMETLNI